MLIAQISDFHVVAPGRLAYGQVDTNAMLARAIATLNQLDPQPDLVIGSGDLVQSGRPEEYAELRRILAPLKAPFAPAAGNHDARTALASAFPWLALPVGPTPFIQYVRALDGIRIVVLDTVTEGSDDASFCPLRAEWFDNALSALDAPVLVVTHHPPFPTAIPWMDPADLDWTHHLGQVIERHPGKVIGLVSGHIHRAIHTQAFGLPASSCPSTAHQVALDLAATEPLLSHEAPGFQLHRWDGVNLTTYTASLERFGDTFAPTPVIPLKP